MLSIEKSIRENFSPWLTDSTHQPKICNVKRKVFRLNCTFGLIYILCIILALKVKKFQFSSLTFIYFSNFSLPFSFSQIPYVFLSEVAVLNDVAGWKKRKGWQGEKHEEHMILFFAFPFSHHGASSLSSPCSYLQPMQNLSNSPTFIDLNQLPQPQQ